MLSAKATILCINDRSKGPIARKALLENHGYEVLEASGVDEGMKLFRLRNVDAVLLGDPVPGRNHRVAEKLKRIHSHVPIMLVSESAAPPRKKLRSVDLFLTTSQPPNILLSKLQGLLDNQPKSFFARWLEQWRTQNGGNT
jgi:CheY-like chemotaxis protein